MDSLGIKPSVERFMTNANFIESHQHHRECTLRSAQSNRYDVWIGPNEL